MGMTEKASPSPPSRGKSTSDAGIDPLEEAMARARLRRLRAKPAFQPRTISHDIRKVTRKHLKGHGTPLAKLKDAWPSLVGERLATLCKPKKLTGGKAERTLELAVLPAAATLIEHEQETIRQRVSVAAGGNITKLKLNQTAWAGTGHKSPKAPPRALTYDEQLALEEQVAGIKDPALKAAIVALGTAVLTDDT